MRVVPVVCFALATAIAGSMLPVVSSYAQTYPDEARDCAASGSSVGGDYCMHNHQANTHRRNHDRGGHSR